MYDIMTTCVIFSNLPSALAPYSAVTLHVGFKMVAISISTICILIQFLKV